MKLFRGLPLVLSLVLASTGPAEEPPAVNRMAEFVLRLDAPTRAERSEAERQLLELGPAAIPSLQRLVQSKRLSPNAADAVQRIIRQLQQERAEQSVEASRVSLSYEGPLGGCLALIAQQTGNRFTITPEQAAKPVRIDVRDRSFWEAMETIFAQTRLQPADLTTDGALTLQQPSEAAELRKVTGVSGPFRLTAGPASVRPIVGQGGQLIRLPLAVIPEPRLRTLFLTYHAKEVALHESNGKEELQTLPPFSPGTKLEVALAGTTASADLRLDYLLAESQAAPNAVRLTGRLMMTVAADEEAFAFPLGSSVAEVRRPGVTVQLGDIERAGGDLSVEINTVYARGGPAFESYRTWIYHNEAELQGPGGERIDHEPNFATRAAGGGGVTLRYHFANVPDQPGWRFAYRAPTSIIDLPIEFDLGPLPIDAEPLRD